MKRYLIMMAVGITLLFPETLSAQSDELDNYVQRLKLDKLGALKETGYLSAGSDFLYAQEFFEAKNYLSAEWYFLTAVKKAKDNAFANYQLALSLIRQNDPLKNQQAQEYLEASFSLNPALRERFKKDVPVITANVQIQNTAPSPAPAPTPPLKDPAGKNVGLKSYIESLKYSKTIGGTETSMGTAGREALYGLEYYEAKDYFRAETAFGLSLAKDPDNAYVNYLMAVSMSAQGKTEAAKAYYRKAVTTDPSLAESFNEDLVAATNSWQKSVEAKKIKIAAPIKKTFGGPLVFGDYVCHQSEWNGPNKSPAYSFRGKGYFQLNSNGTYRWLDNGETGRYQYDAKTGEITWLSGFFKTSGVKSTQYQLNIETVQMSVNFNDPVTWECSCKKK